MERENTLIMYSLKDSNEFIYEGIADAYDKHKSDTILIYSENIDLENKSCDGKWDNAKIVLLESIQEIKIYLIPDGFTIEDWKDVIRVTPNTMFPVLTSDNKIVNKHAYLLLTGDQLLFEESQYNNDDNDKISGTLKLMTRSIAKVENISLNESKLYYNFIFDDKQKYYLLPNGNITHSLIKNSL